MSKKSKKPSCNENFEEGDFVGAKIKGHPLWPAKILKVEAVNKKSKITVRFFGTEETGSSFIQLKHFADLTDKEKCCTRRGFQDALRLCQNEYDSTVAESNDLKTLESVEIKPAILDPEDTKVTVPQRKAKRKREDDDAPKAVKEKKLKVEKLEEPMLEPASVDDINNTIANEASIISNNRVPPAMHTILKLKEKLAEKLKEKEALKRMTKDQRILDKVCAKFKVLSLRFKNFVQVLEELSTVNSFTDQDNLKLKKNISNYFTNLETMDICVKHFMNGKSKMKDLNDCQDCHSCLREITYKLNKSRYDGGLPEKLRKELKACRKRMKSNGALVDFINADFEDIRDSIIERKENGSEKGTF